MFYTYSIVRYIRNKYFTYKHWRNLVIKDIMLDWEFLSPHTFGVRDFKGRMGHLRKVILFNKMYEPM